MNYPGDELPMNLVCSSLRQRRVWASTATQLRQSDPRHWREANLGTHDIALGIPNTNPTGGDNVFRLILLSADDIPSAQTLPRIQQLHNLNPGHNAAIIFLLEQDNTTQPAMQQFMELHILLTMHSYPIHLPIIPLPTLASLPTTLQAFHSSLVTTGRGSARGGAAQRGAAAAGEPLVIDATHTQPLLQSCTTSTNMPLPGRVVDMLGGRFSGFREMLEAAAASASTKEDGDRDGVVRGLGEVLGEGEAGRVGAFWGWEFATS